VVLIRYTVYIISIFIYYLARGYIGYIYLRYFNIKVKIINICRIYWVSINPSACTSKRVCTVGQISIRLAKNRIGQVKGQAIEGGGSAVLD
jgi:hypothetical protein